MEAARISYEECLKEMLTAPNIADISADIVLLQYQGFDPLDFHVQNVKKAANMKEYVKDVNVIIAYGIQRGTSVVSKGEDRSTKEAWAVMKPLVKKYELVDSVGELKRGVNTISRFMAAYASAVAVALMNNPHIRTPGSAGIIPSCYCFPSAASLIPLSQDYEPFFEMFLDWSVTFDKTINSKIYRQKTTKDKKGKETEYVPPSRLEIRSKARQFASVARQNPLVPDAFRLEFFVKNKALWVTAAKSRSERFKQLYGFCKGGRTLFVEDAEDDKGVLILTEQEKKIVPEAEWI